ncbi:MAG: hypothetical protein A2X67_08700 [Ignavibacteria bacterium GWA2_55_11]|nr:MAG: hypothetical protein A2X67_08700 [Ignavibacteria bacterium GWA2_55_11]OGU46675.1 MAG: hypothetical protein A2X68_13405 [Ignavibacteria bacterium GWC2_56_12]OGU68211.1 MAG: hypothetical protein A3C56_07440 [Ignavibacteria bacterium RIFCSPHIGHO2_02_FULL_56_12]OGU70367.1 MAG: hypothetical protein A3G43_11280 [Ignavibacteria bacterium RIFCSPLOWO2_12_FULL_56_21]OGU73806.1 MAG: hypothetical protein A3H45_14000 [Ignavibacteria bacterium RIFCSPLOWO2_02_FULL_55_14]
MDAKNAKAKRNISFTSHFPRGGLSSLSALAAYVLFMPGCSLFEPREPEQPAVLRSTFNAPTEPLTVLDNMTAAFRELNAVNYLRCLSDSLSSGPFSFEPTPAAASGYGIFAEWTKSSEEHYFTNIRSRLPSGTAMILSFGTPSLQSIQADSVLVEVTYDLSVPHGQEGVPQRGIGRAQMMMYLDRPTGFWSIRRWSDLVTDSNAETWSDVKGAFGQ